MIPVDELIAWLGAEAEDWAQIEALEKAAVQHLHEPGGPYFGPPIEIVEPHTYRGGVIALGNTPTVDPAAVPPLTVVVEEWDGGAWIPVTDFHRAGRLLYLNGWRSFTSPVHLRVRYTAGYEPGQEPEDVKQAVRMLVADWYKNREGYKASGEDGAPIEAAVRTIVAKYR